MRWCAQVVHAIQLIQQNVGESIILEWKDATKSATTTSATIEHNVCGVIELQQKRIDNLELLLSRTGGSSCFRLLLSVRFGSRTFLPLRMIQLEELKKSDFCFWQGRLAYSSQLIYWNERIECVRGRQQPIENQKISPIFLFPFGCFAIISH